MPHNQYDGDWLTSPETQQRILHRVRRKAGESISRQLVQRMGMETAVHLIGDRVTQAVAVEVLSEHLPPHTITHHVQYEHPEAIGQSGTAVDSRFARPIDHFTAKYRGTWWGRLLGLKRRKIEYQFVAVPYIVSAPVQCDHLVTVDVRASWTYPKADLVLPADQFGPVVLDARNVTSESQATYRERQNEAFADMVKAHDRARGGRW